jgi:hypothetical protein
MVRAMAAIWVVLAGVAGALVGASVVYGKMAEGKSAAWMDGWKAGTNVAQVRPADQPVTTDDRMGELLAHVVKATFPPPQTDGPVDQPDMDAPYDEPLLPVPDWTDGLIGYERPDAMSVEAGAGIPGLDSGLPDHPWVQPVQLGDGDEIE